MLAVVGQTTLKNDQLRRAFISEYSTDSPPVAQVPLQAEEAGTVLERAKVPRPTGHSHELVKVKSRCQC